MGKKKTQRRSRMKIEGMGSVVSGFFTRSHMKDVPPAKDGGQKVFEAIRRENPAPLSKGAQELVEYRGLKDPLAANIPGRIDAYA